MRRRCHRRAIQLSREKYCSAWNSLRQDIPLTVTYEVARRGRDSYRLRFVLHFVIRIMSPTPFFWGPRPIECAFPGQFSGHIAAFLHTAMINVAAIRMQQFGVQFYQASLTARDIDKLVRFEVLSYGEQAQPAGARRPPAPPGEGELGPARAAHRVEREGLPAPDHPAEDRRAGPVLRAVPAGARPAVDSRRRHHLLRREARRSSRRRRRLAGVGIAEGAGARRHPARDRRPAPAARAARRHRSVRRGGVHGAGDHLRPAARGSRRPDVRDDQREAHAAERVAPGHAVGPAALSRREPGGGARRRARAERPRGLAAVRATSSCSASGGAASRRRRWRRS